MIHAEQSHYEGKQPILHVLEYGQMLPVVCPKVNLVEITLLRWQELIALFTYLTSRESSINCDHISSGLVDMDKALVISMYKCEIRLEHALGMHYMKIPIPHLGTKVKEQAKENSKSLKPLRGK